MKQRLRDKGYSCPYCGHYTTVIIQTCSFDKCVIRKRKCLTCAKTHETTEVLTEFSQFWDALIPLLRSNHEKNG